MVKVPSEKKDDIEEDEIGQIDIPIILVAENSI